MEAVGVSSHRSTRRVAWGALTLALLLAVVLELVRHGTGYWQAAAFGFGPDLSLLVGASPGLARGQLHPRAVPLYNAVHLVLGPLVLALAAAFFLPLGFFVGALAWGLHVSLDRSVGYGLRTPDGFQRP